MNTTHPETQQKWNNVLQFLEKQFGRKPDLQGILFLIGVQELGKLPTEFSKDEKQDLMHIAVCKLLQQAGYYQFTHRDTDGWPHYETLKPLPTTEKGLQAQEELLKQQIILYFENII